MHFPFVWSKTVSSYKKKNQKSQAYWFLWWDFFCLQVGDILLIPTGTLNLECRCQSQDSKLKLAKLQIFICHSSLFLLQVFSSWFSYRCFLIHKIPLSLPPIRNRTSTIDEGHETEKKQWINKIKIERPNLLQDHKIFSTIEVFYLLYNGMKDQRRQKNTRKKKRKEKKRKENPWQLREGS